MREILPQRLWVGNARDARDAAGLLEGGVAAVVDLAVEELPAQLNREMVYCRFPLVDGAGNDWKILCAAIRATACLIRRQVPTLVCCGAGMSRSPAIVAIALAVASGDTPENCLQQVVADSPHDMSPPLWADIMNVYNSRLVQG
ncbi:MAG: protein phosphatase [Planctomycetes bacterium]|nr:protein phosphatase [Planctomycetota bacterium]